MRGGYTGAPCRVLQPSLAWHSWLLGLPRHPRCSVAEWRGNSRPSCAHGPAAVSRLSRQPARDPMYAIWNSPSIALRSAAGARGRGGGRSRDGGQAEEAGGGGGGAAAAAHHQVEEPGRLARLQVPAPRHSGGRRLAAPHAAQPDLSQRVRGNKKCACLRLSLCQGHRSGRATILGLSVRLCKVPQPCQLASPGGSCTCHVLDGQT